MDKKLQNILLMIFTAIICISGWYIYQQYRPSAYDKLQISFEPVHELVLNTPVNAIELIKSTTADEVLVPDVDTSTLGRQQLIYQAVNADGETKSFALEVNIVSQLEPVITLNSESVTITQGEMFDPLDYIISCIDETDGELQLSISADFDSDVPGTYTIEYMAKDQDGNEAKAKLQLIVVEKPVIKPPVSDKPSNRPPETPPSAPNANSEQREQPVEETQPHVKEPHENWRFYREPDDGGYSYQDAISACAALGKTKGNYECIPYVDENGEPAGIQIYY